MKYFLDMEKVVPVSEMIGDDEEDTELLQAMLVEAKNYLQHQIWVENIHECYFGLGVGKIVAVFLFHILPTHPDVQDFLWVIVGDIPPLYIAVEDTPNPVCALDAYIGAMEEWVQAVTAGKSLEELSPVNAAPTLENVSALKSRLAFIDKEILALYQEDLH
ncbi:MAG: hypothetical protein GY801_30210 [bacterium]|nr:hypothetical protein [bacterium]